jgi:hypothetical protein
LLFRSYFYPPPTLRNIAAVKHLLSSHELGSVLVNFVIVRYSRFVHRYITYPILHKVWGEILAIFCYLCHEMETGTTEIVSPLS